MENSFEWTQVAYEKTNIPHKRWGHRTCNIDDQIILFGGFTDVKYLNDLWAFNFKTNTWKEISTTGKHPEPKSNCTMHYDSVTNQIIIFGGGGPNKARFNKISLLNWETKVWRQVEYLSNDKTPWERTYHSSQFKYPYLITFGGQGVANLDFDDFWAFNIQTEKWIQLHDQSQTKTLTLNRPKARRFHQSTMIGNTLYLVGGCYSNYICLPEVFSIDLSNFFNNSEQKIEWKKLKFTAQQQIKIQKWGHSINTYNGKIYLFGGRNQVDFNELTIIDPISQKINKVQVKNQQSKIPKCRRKHSSCIIGSSLIIFGGFNSEYYSDMHFISLKPSLKQQIQTLKDSQTNYQVIFLQQESFQHFLIQNSKTKVYNDLQLIVNLPNSKKKFSIESIQNRLCQKSLYFQNAVKNLQGNPQKRTLEIILPLTVSLQSFKIFHNFLMKDVLVVPKDIDIEQIHELLFLSDYFLQKSFKQLSQIILLKHLNTQPLELKTLVNILNIATSFKLQKISKICATAISFSNQKNPFQSQNFVFSYSNCSIKGQKLIQQMINEQKFYLARRWKWNQKSQSKVSLLNLNIGFNNSKIRVCSAEKLNENSQKQIGFFGTIIKSIKNIRKNSDSEAKANHNN